MTIAQAPNAIGTNHKTLHIPDSAIVSPGRAEACAA